MYLFLLFAASLSAVCSNASGAVIRGDVAHSVGCEALAADPSSHGRGVGGAGHGRVGQRPRQGQDRPARQTQDEQEKRSVINNTCA